ncbi:MAG: glutamine--tRNA ligase/YqeY domain fusion protein [Deltaproteobacteria bacterium]|nr:glutamine--tRNA ligase/YqeY domain fusion protein [Deltaproteobacteria bacterium]
MADEKKTNVSTSNSSDGGTEEEKKVLNFVEEVVDTDLKSGKYQGVVTRFPPEPNGYLHIGHAKSICLNFGLAETFGGRCHLRFDDTNPAKEDVEYTDAIQRDVKWLGFDWGEHLYYTSDSFGKLYEWAQELIKSGDAYVDSQTHDEMRAQRGNLQKPGANSPHRDRSVDENLALFADMKDGKFEDGSCVLRAKIDMTSPIINLRDPVMYRILRATHHRTGDDWCIYPMYDWAHGQCDAIEHITHSICTLEFVNHRPLYDWFVDHAPVPAVPKQTEFARLNLNYTVMSKRKLLQLVEQNHVDGWDDPRMLTISGMRRRGYSPKSVRNFIASVGVSRNDGIIDMSKLEAAVRDDLNEITPRYMAVMDPLKVVITNYPDDQEEELVGKNHPMDESMGTRMVPFSKVLYIDRADFMEDAPKKFFRLAPGKEVRLKYAYFVTCNEVIKDDEGKITELHVTYDPDSKGGKSPDGRKVKGTLHWVSAQHAVKVEARLYDRLFSVEKPDDDKWLEQLNPNSLTINDGVMAEPAVAELQPGEAVQFERTGYFNADSRYSKPGKPVFNRVVGLKDSWAKIMKKG